MLRDGRSETWTMKYLPSGLLREVQDREMFISATSSVGGELLLYRETVQMMSPKAVPGLMRSSSGNTGTWETMSKAISWHLQKTG